MIMFETVNTRGTIHLQLILLRNFRAQRWPSKNQPCNDQLITEFRAKRRKDSRFYVCRLSWQFWNHKCQMDKKVPPPFRYRLHFSPPLDWLWITPQSNMVGPFFSTKMLKPEGRNPQFGGRLKARLRGVIRKGAPPPRLVVWLTRAENRERICISLGMSKRISARISFFELRDGKETNSP